MDSLKPIAYYLREYSFAKAQMDVLREELSKLCSLKETTKIIPVTTENGEAVNAVSDKICRVSSMLLREINKIGECCENITEAIRSLPDPEMRAVFEYRYFERMAFWKIAKKLNISDTKAKALHKSGLAIINSKYHITEPTATDSFPRPR